MANFLPLKNYILYCTDKLIDYYGLRGPFLDIGCGSGDVSKHMALKGWRGKALDFSDIAIETTKRNLVGFVGIEIEKKSLFKENSNFNTVFLLDVLEHIDNDKSALEKIASLLSIDGYLLISVPSNPREWRWDDDFYGHYKRFTAEEMKEKLKAAQLQPLIIWDFTYPFFWLMRRVYTKLKSSVVDTQRDKLNSTAISSSRNAWAMPFFSSFLSRKFIFWQIIYKIQFTYFKDKVNKGFEMLILAKRQA